MSKTTKTRSRRWCLLDGFEGGEVYGRSLLRAIVTTGDPRFDLSDRSTASVHLDRQRASWPRYETGIITAKTADA